MQGNLAGLTVRSRREANFGTCQVEPNHALGGELDGNLGHLYRVCVLTHRVNNESHWEPKVLLATPQSGQDRSDHLTAIEFASDTQRGCHARLCVHHAVARQILRGLVCDPLNCRLRQHHADGVSKRFEVPLQRR